MVRPFHFLSTLILLFDAALSKSLLGVRVSKCAQAIEDDEWNFTSCYYLVSSTLITLHLVQLACGSKMEALSHILQYLFI